MTESLNTDINDERAVRLRKLHDLVESGIDPYPATAERSHPITEALVAAEGATVSVVGRIVGKRELGKIIFCHIQDGAGRIQAVFNHREISAAQYDLFQKNIDSGDFISVTGERFVTKRGEPSVLVRAWKLLAKSLRPLPDKFHGLADEELRLRQRYLELLLHAEVRDRFRRKALFWQSLRQFLIAENFLEVETPVLETTTGGAEATPFATHLNALDIDVYLRISMGELWQKRLMVGGFEKTFEIGRQFRNEGLSREHLQDYTQMEFYWAYANYEDGMSLVERMMKKVIQETWGKHTFTIGDFGEINLAGPWGRIDYTVTIKEKTGVDVVGATNDEIRATLDRLGIAYDKTAGRGRLVDTLWKYCRKTVAGPVFLINLPVIVSPLAKRKKDNPQLTERYQIIIAGSELGNGYSELNDPIDQAERFTEQCRLREAGDSEAQMYDYEFVAALEQGMPPTTGFGLSERFFAFLENKPVRDCVLFPLVRPLEE